jgi:soluble lytic murein transglycosylase
VLFSSHKALFFFLKTGYLMLLFRFKTIFFFGLVVTFFFGGCRAEGVRNHLAKDLAFWIHHQQDKDSTLSFLEGERLLARHPDWPLLGVLQRKMERQLETEKISPQRLASFFRSRPPQTAEGWMIFFKALKQIKKMAELRLRVRNYWHKARMSADDEKTFLAQYKRFLSPYDHRVRLRFMIFSFQPQNLRRLMAYLDRSHKVITSFAADCLEGKGSMVNQWKTLSRALRTREVVIWAYLQYLRKKKDFKTLIRTFLTLPKKLSDSHHFYKLRILVGRELLEEGKFQKAYDVLRQHHVSPSRHNLFCGDLEWHAGWVALSYLDQPRKARNHFECFLKTANKTPISLSRGHYWLGRAFERLGYKQNARRAYLQATKHPAAFYGQMALQKLGRPFRIGLVKSVYVPLKKRHQFASKPMVRAVKLLKDMGVEAEAWVLQFLAALKRQMKDCDERCLLLELASQTHPFMVVELSRNLWVKDIKLPLFTFAYPIRHVEKCVLPEQALILTTIYRETFFNPQMRGHAGEYGLMQIMPETAKALARTLGHPFSVNRLWNPDYNAKLGAHYLRKHLDTFNQNYLLAVASYNAGPGRVNYWIRLLGTPEKPKFQGKGRLKDTHERVVHWIESLDYTTVRDYVQRFAETFPIYLQRLGLSARTISAKMPGYVFMHESGRS